jgi:phospholipid/cholesterol/gamma-HCH transport system substrate-binding protein
MSSLAREQQSIRDALAELPGTLRQTRGALESGDGLARTLGPASRDLIPAAHALAPALRRTRPFLRQTVAPIRDQIRPFSHRVQPPVKHLAQGAEPLGKSTQNLAGAFGDLNPLLNALAFNPVGDDEGYLFWLTWLNHDTNGLFFTQDADGPLRRGIVLQSCSTAQLAESVASLYPFLRTVQQITNVATSAEIAADGGC